MRALSAIAISILLLMPLGSATQPIIPKVTVQLSPSVQNVTVSPTQKGTAQFSGNVTVEKPPVVRMVVSLVSTIDKGWPSSCDPTPMVITDTSPHSFGVTVVVPEGTPNSTGILTVTANATGMGLTITATATAMIVVKGPSAANQTSQNKTATGQGSSAGTAQNSTSGSSAKTGGIDLTTVSIVAVVLVAAVAGGGGYYVIRRRRRRNEEAG